MRCHASCARPWVRRAQVERAYDSTRFQGRRGAGRTSGHCICYKTGQVYFVSLNLEPGMNMTRSRRKTPICGITAAGIDDSQQTQEPDMRRLDGWDRSAAAALTLSTRAPTLARTLVLACALFAHAVKRETGR